MEAVGDAGRRQGHDRRARPASRPGERLRTHPALAPEWFGNESASSSVNRLPTFVAEADGASAAFLTLRPTSDRADT